MLSIQCKRTESGFCRRPETMSFKSGIGDHHKDVIVSRKLLGSFAMQSLENLSLKL